MPQRLLSRPERRRLSYLRQQVRQAGLTLHTRLRRINLSADFSLDELTGPARGHVRELCALAGYQLQVYIPSADPRQDRCSPFLNSLIRPV